MKTEATGGPASGPLRVPDSLPRSVDWKAERDRIDLAAVASALLGPPPGRRGERGRRLWWCCPLHPDRNPSFCVDPAKRSWRCYGCGERGDAVSLVMRLQNTTFPEAVAYLTGGPTPPPTRPGKATARPAVKPPPPSTVDSTGLPEAEALALVEAAAKRLWAPDGRDDLAHLTGPRCLAVDTIRSARIGSVPPGTDGIPWKAPGIAIPWFSGDRLVRVNLRVPDAWRDGYAARFPDRKTPPKYLEVFHHPARRVCYPTPDAIRPGRPVVVVEGELDALALGEALGELAAVVTTGSASSGPTAALVARMLAATRWYAAHDNDPAGDKAAASWPARARRVRPPGSFKDWTEAKAAGVDLARWWRDILAGVERPALYSWSELSRWRWGGADDAHGIIIPARCPVASAQGVEP